IVSAVASVTSTKRSVGSTTTPDGAVAAGMLALVTATNPPSVPPVSTGVIAKYSSFFPVPSTANKYWPEPSTAPTVQFPANASGAAPAPKTPLAGTIGVMVPAEDRA